MNPVTGRPRWPFNQLTSRVRSIRRDLEVLDEAGLQRVSDAACLLPEVAARRPSSRAAMPVASKWSGADRAGEGEHDAVATVDLADRFLAAAGQRPHAVGAERRWRDGSPAPISVVAGAGRGGRPPRSSIAAAPARAARLGWSNAVTAPHRGLRSGTACVAGILPGALRTTVATAQPVAARPSCDGRSTHLFQGNPVAIPADLRYAVAHRRPSILSS